MENITVNMENLTEEERKQLLALVEKGNGHKKLWKPEEGETYYIICTDGTTENQTWDNGLYDKKAYKIGNCFRTKEEAKFAVEKRKVEVELKRFADEHNDGEIDWNSGKTKYYMAYDTALRKINIHRVVTMKESTVYFTSINIAKQAIQEIGEDCLKKYYFELEEGK